MIARIATAVTASDSTTFASNTIGLYVGGAGNVTLTINGSDILFTAVPVGTILPVSFSKVKSTGTTATAMVALYE